jgi:hypothetical protein
MQMVSTALYSRVPHNRLPGSTGLGSQYEEFWLRVVPPVDSSNVVLVDRLEDANGAYAMFTVTYRADPLLESVSSMLTSLTNAPIGVDTIVKAGPMVVIDALTVRFRRKAGTTMALDAARVEIAAYVNGVSFPELFSEAPIVESMYAAGALRTQAISYSARLSLTPSTRRFAHAFDPSTSTDWNTNSLPCPVSTITTTAGMRPYELFTGSVSGIAELYAVTDRNVRYFILPENIIFVEQQ